MTTTRKQRETDMKRENAGGRNGEACRYSIFTVDQASGLTLALAVMGVDTLKHVRRISGIMGKWKGIEL